MRICCVLTLVAACAGGAARADVQNPYRFERGGRYYKDVLQQRDGTMKLGKILEWADRVLVYGQDGKPASVDARDVDWIQTRRDKGDSERGNLPDLTVAYIERLPHATSWQGSVAIDNGVPSVSKAAAADAHPKDGQSITFRVHILNAGNKASAAVDCNAAIDGQSLGSPAKIPPIEPGQAHVAEFTWKWRDDADKLEIDIDPRKRQAEWLRWNNHFSDPVRGLAVDVVVPRDVYEAFQNTPNLVDSFCFEDYAQYHLHCFNGLLAASVYPTSPDGVVERVRLDRVIIADDVDSAATRKGPVNDHGVATYDALLVMGRGDAKSGEGESVDPLRVNWAALKQLGGQLGLVDASVFETRPSECGVYDKFGRPAIVRHVPMDANSLMRRPGPFHLSEVDAAYLNHVAGMPRGLHGTYLYQLPENVVIEVAGANGAPVPNVAIDVFQLHTNDDGTRTISGPGGTDPWVATETDGQGRAKLPNRPAPTGQTPDGYTMKPNPFGGIALDGGNGLLLLRLRQDSPTGPLEAFHFLSLATCNEACLHGHAKEYVHRITTRFADSPGQMPAVPRLPYAFSLMPERDTEHPDLTVGWPVSSGIDLMNVSEYRVYRRMGFGGTDTSPWALVATVAQPLNKPANNHCQQPYFEAADGNTAGDLDTWFAVSVADRSGREGALSEPMFLPYGKQCHKLAIKDTAAYITLSGEGPPIMLYFDGVAGTQAYLPHTSEFPGYSPHYEGIAFGQQGLIVTDPVNNVLAVYDTSRGRHELIDTIPHRDKWPGPPSFFDGEFDSPADVASDSDGNLYVADRGNHRVQILTPDGKYKALLDPDFRFRGPHAVAQSYGRLCVTDNDGTRVRVYDLRSGEPKFVLELPPLVDADRGLVTVQGKILVTGRVAEGEPWGLQLFKPDGQSATLEKTINKAMMGQCYAPRGLYQYEGQRHLAYFVNSFPFGVRAITIGTPPGTK